MATRIYASAWTGSASSGKVTQRAYLDYTVTVNDPTTYTVVVSSGIQQWNGTWTKIGVTCGLTNQSNVARTITQSGGSYMCHEFIGNRTFTYTKPKSAQSVTITATSTITSGVDSSHGSGTVLNKPSYAYLSFNIPLKDNWAVTYDNNGGTGTIAAQTKWYNEDLVITTSAPTRTGYNFAGWYDNADGTGQNYAGTTYTTNAGIILYAKWTPQTRTITYNANGGTGTIAPQTKTYGEALTLSNGSGFTRTDYTITGWNTQANNSGTAYALSQKLDTTFLSDLTLYAQWRLDYTSLSISNTRVYRVASSSSTTETDDGRYIYVGFNYIAGSLPSASLAPTVNVKINGTSVYTATLSASGTSFSRAFGTYSADNSYTVLVTLSDAYGRVSFTATVSTATYPIDLYGTGTDVYMGIMSPYENGTALKIHSFKTEDINATGDVTVTGNVDTSSDIIIELDNNAGSGTDYEILTALNVLGWDCTPD